MLEFTLDLPLKYELTRDYFRSAINILSKKGYTFSNGISCEVTGNIPINSGTSSSSALLCTWIGFLIQCSDQKTAVSTKEIGEFAFEAEVLEFNEAGGMMDQYSTAVGDIIFLESEPTISIEFLQPKLGTFVLGDSCEPKDTQKILSWVKFGMLEIIDIIKKKDPNFSLKTVSEHAIEAYKALLSDSQYALLKGNIQDRDILLEAKSLMQEADLDHNRFGALLNKHMDNLRDAKKVSTPKIDRMVAAALQAGALGAKINGSGGGGCMFAYAPTNAEVVAKAIEEQGGKAYIITIDKGQIVH
jgi:galactokinase